MKDFHIQWLASTPLIYIGEVARRLSIEYKEAHREVKWEMFSETAKHLLHDYDDTDWEIIANIVFEEVPVLIEQLGKYIDQ